ncbi:Pulcherriminic acid synthase [Paraconexibacter sp. AEG42_29]|uniref:Pulcherriminic acid synthase n=1 Tax=Paraconexibacter sp. AEG42_29 TaxID=2997339 RepID=A0AAU7B4D1_9ACTN
MSVSAPRPPDPLTPEHLVDPWPNYEILRDHHPIVWHEPTQSWLISRYEHIRPLLRDQTRWSTEHMQDQLGLALGDAPTMTAMDGKQHSARRSLVSPFLFTGGLDLFTPTIERRAKALLEPVFAREREAVAAGTRERGRLDFVTEFSSVYPVDIMADMMGLPGRDYGLLREWYNAFITFVGNIAGDPVLIERGLKAKQGFGEYILPLIAERRSGDGDDFISRLCRAEVEGDRMDDEDIRSFLALMLLAGGETTDHQLAALLHALVQHPDQLQALADDRSLMDDAMAEGMRYCAIVQFIQRTAREDVDIDGTVVPAGGKITLMLAAGNRDPRRFEDPDRFDIHRTDHATSRAFTGNADHLGFGGGRHVCLGMQLSKREVETALNHLLDNAADLRLADGYRAEHEGFFVRSLTSLDLTYTPR